MARAIELSVLAGARAPSAGVLDGCSPASAWGPV